MKTEHITLPIYNLGCGGGGTLAIKSALMKEPGVVQAYVNPLTEMVYIVYNPAAADPEQLAGVIDRSGYGAPCPNVYREETTHMIEQPAQPIRRWWIWAIQLLIVVVVASLALWIWSTTTTTRQANIAPAAAPSDGTTQTNEGGQVTIAAMWQGSGAGPVFSVAMNTHAVDLDGYDLKQLATLHVDGGPQVQPTSWQAPKGGHHRSGTLTFPATTADGAPLIAPGTHTVELVIRDVAGVPERVFTWRQ